MMNGMALAMESYQRVRKKPLSHASVQMISHEDGGVRVDDGQSEASADAEERPMLSELVNMHSEEFEEAFAGIAG